MRARWIVLLWLALAVLTPARASLSPEQALASVDFRQNIGASIPTDLRFTARDGDAVALGSLTRDKPLVLVLSWFECPNLCPLLLDRLAGAAAELPFDADRYRVAAVSIDPQEGPPEARHLAQRLAGHHDGVTANWHFLTGEESDIRKLADAVGFEYAYDKERDRYAHPAGYVVVSPDGRISHYLMGISPRAPDLKLALVQAGQGKVGSPVQKLLLRCYRFNPEKGQYSLAVMRLLQLGGGGFVLALGGTVFWLRRRERS